ncbi:alginate lyase-domain-containing protein [Crucibulum laeve]|uniref:Alginate lyase-domain-containing protein n=1 Tax=Crucibulum laeve TaxID=68775 RepID=A0A5C3LUF6_9AGAR|nr:alginate lyase-domain-containing protein [Crucibulum laeve]
MPLTFLHLLFLSSCIFLNGGVRGQTSYANDFVNPDYVVARDFGNNTRAAQLTIVKWAKVLAQRGPWSVMDKAVLPPSGDKHDYMSWAPYWWPDCSAVGNTTELPQEEVWKQCEYKARDGQFNPDGRLVNDVGNFQLLSDAVLYNAITWSFNNQPTSNFYSKLLVPKFIKAWFLDTETRMNPNLNYGQMQRGPTGQLGSHTGILDLKGLTKITSAILMLRNGKSEDWDAATDAQMIAWAKEYITWLETAEIAVEEGIADNNHGTFYYNQLAALKILVSDFTGAKAVTDTYFNKQYLYQIEANGEQVSLRPLEAARTRPYHYRAYNLAAMITNARLAEYADPSSPMWNKTTTAGATIKTALDFALSVSPAASQEASYAAELYPSIAAVAATYGDADGKYLTFLKNAQPAFAEDPYFFWNQPWAVDLDISGLVGSTSAIDDDKITNAGTSTAGTAGAVSANSAVASKSGLTLGMIAVSALCFIALA